MMKISRTLLNVRSVIMLMLMVVQSKRSLSYHWKVIAHRDYNININLNHKIPIVSHNPKNYDSHLIVQELGKVYFKVDPAGNCTFKVNNRNTRTRCEIRSKLTMKILERLASFCVFIVNFKHISHLVFVLVFLLLTLSR